MSNTQSEHFKVFPWHKNFETGISLVDEQHETLVELLNKLALHLVTGDSIALTRVFDELAAYADYHFKTEEGIWTSCFDGDDWLVEHKKTHASFFPQVLKLKALEKTKPLDVVIEDIVSFLIKWLIYHILDTDKRMAIAVREVNDGQSLEQAKVVANEEMSGQVQGLVSTVLAMYDSLSSRTMELMKEREERRRAEEALKHQSELLQTALESIDQGFVVWDQNDRLVAWNSRVLDFWYSPMDVHAGMTKQQILTHIAFQGGLGTGGSPAELAEARYQELLAEGPDDEFTMTDGREIAVSRYPMSGIGFAVVYTDVTEARRSERKLIESNNELERMVTDVEVSRSKLKEQAVALAELAEEQSRLRDVAEAANTAKSAFLANMSHEIRTPMNGVVGMLDVLSHSRLSEDDQRMVTSIRNSATSLLGIINDILDFSKIEAGKMELAEEAMSVEDEFDMVAGLMDRLALERQVDLTLFFDPNIPSTLVGDALKLRQVLTNLINNAIKFSSGQGRIGRVFLRAELNRKDDKSVWIDFRVADNGIGMSEQTVSKLFKSFEQADGGTTRKYGGTGLGLVISRNLAQIMGGDVSVESTVGEGSVFTLHVPFALPDDMGEEQQASALSGLHCVIVDDEKHHAADFGVYLRHAGVEVHAVEQLPEAWKIIRDNNYPQPVCVLVLEDPGLETAQEIVERLLRGVPQGDFRLIEIAYLSIERGKRRKVRKLADNVHQIDREVLTRRSLLNGVAIATGREGIPASEFEDAEQIKKGGAVQSRSEAISQNRLILVAEDNLTNLDVIRRQLELLGYAVDLAEDGVEAYQKWRSECYGLVITDLHMPNMDGYDLTTAIRRDEQHQGLSPIPILALTANALKGEEDRCLDLGMNAYLTKPIELQKLGEILETYLPARVDVDGENGETATGDGGRDARFGHAADAVVDPTMLSRMVGDDAELQARLIGGFLDTTENLLDEFEALYAAHDADAYGALAHRLKSSVRSFGANQLGRLFEDLERAGKSGDWATIEARHTRVKPAFHEVRAFYEK